MNEIYTKELEALKVKMEEAEKFAEHIPIFAEQILANKFTGNEDWIHFGDKYKDIYLGWGIKRGLYQTGTRRTITNYEGESYAKFLFCIYVNTYALFGDHYQLCQHLVAERTPVFFYDKWNSTFYATDEQIEGLLEELNKWYLGAREEVQKVKNKKRIEDAKKQIEIAEKELAKLTPPQP